ncbi:hypothetical protein A2U01_0116698, partial [Trifolium medium]|nr:hypothetical protein [Trifolium medium]
PHIPRKNLHRAPRDPLQHPPPLSPPSPVAATPSPSTVSSSFFDPLCYLCLGVAPPFSSSA